MLHFVCERGSGILLRPAVLYTSGHSCFFVLCDKSQRERARESIAHFFSVSVPLPFCIAWEYESDSFDWSTLTCFSVPLWRVQDSETLMIHLEVESHLSF